MRRTAVLIAILGAAAVPAGGAQGATTGGHVAAPRGDLIVTFSGTGGGSYRFHAPAQGTSNACRGGDATYNETDSYSWSYTFVVPPTGGTSVAPLSLGGSGLLSSTELTRRCAGSAVNTTTCVQALRPPTLASAGDLAFPGVNVVASARQITVGALGELLRSGAQPSCTGEGAGTLIPNPVRGFQELQASVTFPRAALAKPNGFSGTFTMGGAGLYDGVPLSGSCNSATCDPQTCAQVQPGGGGPPASCTFNESYSGTIEVRVVR
jgi:hypothetical protein